MRECWQSSVTMGINMIRSINYYKSVPLCFHNFHAGIIDLSVTFQLTSYLVSIDVSFSLTCNSTGGLVNSLIWRRDGFLLDNTASLVLTDSSTLSYTNVLQVNSRTTGEYTCLIRGPNDNILNSTIFIVQGSNYPDF